MTEDLDRLLNRAEMRGNLPVGEIRPLIERVKEAERKLVFEHMEATRQAAERQKAEAKLRAAEEVVEAARHYDNYNGTPRIRTAFRHYDEAVNPREGDA